MFSSESKNCEEEVEPKLERKVEEVIPLNVEDFLVFKVQIDVGDDVNSIWLKKIGMLEYALLPWDS